MLSRIRTELTENVRLRLAVAVLACVLLWNGASWLKAASHRAEREWREANVALVRANADAATHVWPDRARDALALKAQVQASLWRQPTLGLAQVRLQEWVRAELEIVGISPRGVGPVLTGATIGGVAAPSDGPAGIVPIRVRFDADFDGAKLDRFLARLQAASPKVYVTQLIVRPDSTQRFEGVAVAYFVNPEAPK